MAWRFILAALGIALLDIVLSGDNALVIAAAASRLPRARRLVAIVWGGIFAIVFRVGLTAAATEVLQVKLIQAIGGVLLIGIAIHVLPNGDSDGNGQHTASDRFFTAIATILIADVTMSLDNILAVGALAHGNVILLASGLLFSMVVLFVASTIIARLMDALPWLLDVAALIIAYTAADLVVADPIARSFFHFNTAAEVGIHVGAVALVLTVDAIRRLRAWRRRTNASRATRTLTGGDGAKSMQNGHQPLEQRGPDGGEELLPAAHQDVSTAAPSVHREPDTPDP
jgi:YjbE family integral membrane protein